jgi:hypothetical protein
VYKKSILAFLISCSIATFVFTKGSGEDHMLNQISNVKPKTIQLKNLWVSNKVSILGVLI